MDDLTQAYSHVLDEVEKEAVQKISNAVFRKKLLRTGI